MPRVAKAPVLRPPCERNPLVERNLKLAYKFAGRYARGYSGPLFEEYLSHATLGLIEGAERWDAGRGIGFATYCVYWIRRRILEGIRGRCLIHIPHYYTFAERRGLEARLRPGPIPAEEWGPAAREGAGVVEEEDERRRRREKLEALLGRLDARDREVLRRRFFLGETLDEVGARVGVSKERVRQIEQKAVRRLRNLARREG